jgi:hypothetical protein
MSAIQSILLASVVMLSCVADSAASTTPTRSPQGTRYVYLIRHGMYDRIDSLDDRTANGLNALGREQARLLGERLRRLPVRPRLLVSSGLTRARETGDELASILGVRGARAPDGPPALEHDGDRERVPHDSRCPTGRLDQAPPV